LQFGIATGLIRSLDFVDLQGPFGWTEDHPAAETGRTPYPIGLAGLCRHDSAPVVGLTRLCRVCGPAAQRIFLTTPGMWFIFNVVTCTFPEWDKA
jgi:hypothetical protein